MVSDRAAGTARQPDDVVIDVAHLRKRYHDLVAVDDVSFTVAEGEILGIVGPNGAGKTTTVECLAGLRARDGGEIAVCGFDPARDRDELRLRVGMQLQAATLPDRLKVWEAVDLYGSYYGWPVDGEALLTEVGLHDLRGRRFGRLSGGEKQRLSLALALVGAPRVAILDELTTGLDPQARRDTWDLIEHIRAAGTTIVLVTHYMEEAERLCDRVAVIDRGRLVALDTPEGLVKLAGDAARMEFRPTAPVPDDVLAGLPGVRAVTRDRGRVVVTGTGDMAVTVIEALSARHVRPRELRVEHPTLDDAFLTLTGHPPGEPGGPS
ncbi:ABC transporter ATP-binding protein [Actinomadura sp. ATCC 31491]|uniref:ABC transporter ATP-binding protein n=1 Tax=Actinomadura luzonensis TaxID=2805427 RepID=A0ABT0GAF3_9ACTN|nr:ABC transporter ATP-binding protein [Actinomadura luzonensis]MCK2221556.1 ABC transporter ATP-binding protein [Actinomadura luzonensis]